MKESQIVGQVKQYIRDLDAPSWARKVHGSPYTDAGEPDVDACVMGRAVKVEVKCPGKRPTPAQYASMRRWQRAGALAGWVTSVDELRELLTHVTDYEWRNPQLEKE